MDLRKKWSQTKVNALEKLLKTFDRFELMPPYLVTVEMKPGTSLDRGSDIIYDQPQKVFGVVIRIIEGTTIRISIDEDEE